MITRKSSELDELRKLYKTRQEGIQKAQGELKQSNEQEDTLKGVQKNVGVLATKFD